MEVGWGTLYPKIDVGRVWILIRNLFRDFGKGRSGGMADALDSGSSGQNPWGFESPFGTSITAGEKGKDF